MAPSRINSVSCCPQQCLFKFLFALVLIGLIVIIVVWYIGDSSLYGSPRIMDHPGLLCFYPNETHPSRVNKTIELLENIDNAEKQPTPGRSIFFLETSCAKDGLVHLNARQACAIESAARMNPERDVFLLSVSPVGLAKDPNLQDPFIKELLTYSNIYMRNIDLWEFTNDTIVEDFMYSGKLFASQFINAHTSDLFRLLTLYKYGGTYLDLDVIVMKPLDSVQENFAGAEDDTFVANGVLDFSIEGGGHDIAELCLSEFQSTFDGSQWAFNGPRILTQILQNVCKTSDTRLMTREKCRGFKVYPVNTFYSQHYSVMSWLFEPKYFDQAANRSKDAVLIHAYNKLTFDRKIKVGDRAYYAVTAEKYCPKVFSKCGEYF